MKFTQLIKNSKNYSSKGLKADFRVKGISCNSKEVGRNFIFVAIKGNKADGREFIREAAAKGAGAVVAQNPAPDLKACQKISFIAAKKPRLALAELASRFYGNPSSRLKVTAVTGTNGKTTVTYLIEAILKETGHTPAVIGTINYRFKGRVIPSKNTTPGPVELQRLLAMMQKKGADHVVMEVSSHGLHQDRTENIDFSSAIFTNLTQDHLDYHGTMSEYFKAKAKLFANLKAGAFAVINNDDSYARKLKKFTRAKTISYAVENDADVNAKRIQMGISRTEFILSYDKKEIPLSIRLIGRHNVYNVLAAFAWAKNQGLDLKKTVSALESFSSVPGRLEKIDSKAGFSVFVDYAHTEDALKNVIGALRRISKDRIIVVFGCGGERDKGKRPKMGKVVSEMADYAIITNDNPRSEEPLDIISDIEAGIKTKNYRVIPERIRAIKKSLSLAQKGDVVLVAGKGHENYQIVKDKSFHFDDREAVRKCLRSMNC
jgi:UDP-N-acetylmuramoyl-L-alanyl-D-glutamate--2,6-diaminopimelate ligase